MQRLKNELKLAGSNLYIICAALLIALTFFAIAAGDLVNLSCIGFEVIYPFFAAITIGEWGKTRADDNYDVIAAQGKSLFSWVIMRYIAIFSLTSLFALLGMASIFLIRKEMPLWEIMLTYFSTAFCLTSFGTLIGLCYSQEHIATLVCGIVWLVELMARGLLRVPGMEYFYLFIRLAGDPNGFWVANKTIIFIIGVAMWFVIYWICRRKPSQGAAYQ